MNPSIGECIKLGFQTTFKSFPGMGVYAASWILILLISFLIFLPTKLPMDALTKISQERGQLVQNQSAETETQTPQPAITPEQQEVIDWMKRGWWALLLVVLLLGTGYVFIDAGLIGYLTQRIRTGNASVSDYLQYGKSGFWNLAGAQVFAATVTLLPILIVTGLFALAAVFQNVLFVILNFVLFTVLIIGLIWISLRLSFLYYAAVADHKSPKESWRVSFASTSGRLLHLIGFGLLIGLIQIIIGLPGNLIPFLGFLIGIFNNFFSHSARLYYYEKVKGI